MLPKNSDLEMDPAEENFSHQNSDNEEKNDPYFSEYGDWSVHELMLNDVPRTSAYRDAIENNAHLFKGKTVMDVGCGTGILSLFCARAGAARVVAVEASRMAALAEKIVKRNGFENLIKIVNEKVEEMKGFDDLKVDIIVSEWMGFYLLHESMLDTVIYARDKWLDKETGLLFPSIAYLYACPVDMSSSPSISSQTAWSDFYGFDFGPMASIAAARRLSAPSVEIVEENQLLSEPQILTSFDLKTVTKEDVVCVFKTLEFEVEEGSTTTTMMRKTTATTTTTSADVASSHSTPSSASSPSASASSLCAPRKRHFHGFACWFDCLFATGLPSPTKPVTLSTRPGLAATHWKQTVLWLPGGSGDDDGKVGIGRRSNDAAAVVVSPGEEIKCHVTLTQGVENPRHYDICVDLITGSHDVDDNVDDDDECDFEGKDHPVPCDCGAARCLLVKTLLEKYAAEETERNEASTAGGLDEGLGRELAEGD